MNTELEKFFKDTPLGIQSVLQGAVFLAEKVNSRTDLSGKEKTDLVVKSLVDFLGEGNPELLALVQGVVPGVLEIVISTARGKYMLKQVTSCLPSCVSAVKTVEAKIATVQDPLNELSAKKASVWAWVSSSFRNASAPSSPAQSCPVTTLREPDSASLAPKEASA
jgi:hypothetical protein